MRIHIDDSDHNWLNWGKLVYEWISSDPSEFDFTVAQLKNLLTAKGITAEVEGADNRRVVVRKYGDNPSEPIVIYIPTKKMLAEKMNLVQHGPYPHGLLPTFYGKAYGGAPRATLSRQEAEELALRRIGEYTVNECC
jgi:hypothetical protein